MIRKNNIIGGIQLFLMGGMIGNSLFVGLGNTILVHTVFQNTWLVALMSLVIGILPALLIYKVLDYSPEIDIFDKSKQLFGKIGGQIVNVLLIIIIFIVFLINIWSITNFSNTKYLTQTPPLFIAFLFLVPAIYASFKGIETIARTIQMLFFFSLFCHFIITTSLISYVNVDNLKPILTIGWQTVADGIIKNVSYVLVPFITFLVIPKKDIVVSKNVKKCFILGYIVAAWIMAHVFFMNMSIVGIELASLYRFPEYYVLKKVSLGAAFDNIENFLSVHWIFNIFSSMMMCMYFMSQYFINQFRIRKVQYRYLLMGVIGLIGIYIPTALPPSSTHATYYMKNYFAPYIGLPALIIIIIMNIAIQIEKRKKLEK